jgi:hypothetical protein
MAMKMLHVRAVERWFSDRSAAVEITGLKSVQKIPQWEQQEPIREMKALRIPRLILDPRLILRTNFRVPKTAEKSAASEIAKR